MKPILLILCLCLIAYGDNHKRHTPPGHAKKVVVVQRITVVKHDPRPRITIVKHDPRPFFMLPFLFPVPSAVVVTPVPVPVPVLVPMPGVIMITPRVTEERVIIEEKRHHHHHGDRDE